MLKNDRISKGKNYTVGLGITSWKSYKTLKKTLDSYLNVGLFDFFDKSLIWFQDISEKDVDIAKEYKIDYAGGPNCGIAEGMRNLSKLLNTDFVLFLENDCAVIEDAGEIKKQLTSALNLLEKRDIDIMRLRHRWEFGEGFSIHKYSRYFPLYEKDENFIHEEYINKAPNFWKAVRRFFRSSKAEKLLGRSVYFEKNPHELFSKYIKKDEENQMFIIDSAVMNWTNQSVLCKKNFFLNVLMPYVDQYPCKRTSNGFQSPERALNSEWWREQHFKISVGRGLFTHARFDDSWR